MYNVFYNISTKVKEKFPEMTDENFGKYLVNNKKPTFPYVLVHRLPGSEVGHTLDKTGVNGILTTFQIEVFSNDSEDVCDKISSYIADIMVGDLMFEMVGEPYPDYTSTDEYRYVSRYRRVVGASDSLSHTITATTE
jgi:hypothetical protein